MTMEGYDAKFDPPLDKRLECPICLLAQREPMQTPCGHRFCSSCILRALRETGPRCPVDNTRVCNHQLFKDNFAKREVLSLNVNCSAGECGCPWHGELRNLEVHMSICELVHIECPNSCGHSCQRQSLSPHLVMCLNKPEQCLHCSIHFSRNRISEHGPNCSGIIVPESIHSNLMKANEVLKWCGTIKLKVNAACSSVFQQAAGSIFQISGYLTAKVDSQESFMFTGNWVSCCSVMPLNAPSAKIFWRTLHGREVQTKSFGVGLLSNDSKSNMFFKILKKKMIDMSAVLGLHLKTGRSRNDLTIIYFYWSEPKRRLMACVAELKSHLVRQIQNRLHVLHNPQRERTSNSDSHLVSRSQSHSRSQSRSELRSMARTGHHHTRHHPIPPPPAPAGPPPPPPPSYPSAGHLQQLHPHIHPAHPAAAAVALLAPVAPGAQPHHHHHLHPMQSHLLPSQLHHDSQQPPMGHPRFLSWQMSQSLNGYPWRVQTGNVPYFSFPSTPPTFLPSNPLPYTFAPAPPFSISQIAQVPSSAVPIPSYAGIAVQGTVVDSMVSGPNGTSFPVAAIPSLTDVSNEHLHAVPPGAVAVTITSANAVPGQPPGTTVVIQQSVMPPSQEAAAVVQNQDMAMLHALGAPPPPPHHYQTPHIPAHIGPAIITADAAGQGLLQNLGPAIPGENVAVGRYHGSMVTPHLVPMAPPPQHNLMAVSLDYSVTSTDSLQGHVRMLPREQAVNMGHIDASSPVGHPLPTSRTRETRALAMLDGGAGPSRVIDSDSDDSMDSNSPSRNFASLIYGMHRYPNPNYDNDSDESSEAPLESDSSDSRVLGDLSAESQLSSDVDDSAGPSSVSDTSSPTNPSTIRHINTNTVTVVISPVPSPTQDAAATDTINLTLNTTYDSSEDGAATSSDELSLPVLINMTETMHSTPVIDLTSSPGVSESNPSLPSASVANTSYGEVPSVFMPVINQQGLESGMFVQNAANESGLQQEMLYSSPIPLPRQGHVIGGQEVQVAARHYGHSIPRQVHLNEREGAAVVADGQQIQLVSHSVVQMGQPLPPHSHTSQLYAAQGQLAPHLIQQPLHNYAHHTHDATQPPFPGYSTHVPSGSGSLEMQPVAAPVIESNPAMAMGANVHVLRWQPTLSAGDMLSSHPGPAVPSHPPSGFPTHQRQGVEQVVSQTPPGNFWDTVMPSLDMSLQGNGGTIPGESLQ